MKNPSEIRCFVIHLSLCLAHNSHSVNIGLIKELCIWQNGLKSLNKREETKNHLGVRNKLKVKSISSVFLFEVWKWGGLYPLIASSRFCWPKQPSCSLGSFPELLRIIWCQSEIHVRLKGFRWERPDFSNLWHLLNGFFQWKWIFLNCG